MTSTGLKWYGSALVFDPSQGQTIIAPPGSGDGHWAGAPSVVYDSEQERYLLYYRVRRPRPIRGGECHIAESRDGVKFDIIWTAHREDFDSDSVERFSLTRALDGRWLLYPSYVDPADGRWRIDVIEADDPAKFDVSARRKLMTAADVGAEGVKDPWVMVVNGLYYMLISYAVTIEGLRLDQRKQAHATADIYNTGLTLSSTGLAVSGDGLSYQWLGDVFAPRNDRASWDAYAARLGCLVPGEYGWVGYYDGGASVGDNYEERTGLVQSWDLRTFHRISHSGPSIVSPEGTGSLRYVDAILRGNRIYLYYEYARADGSHELRLNILDR